MTSMNFSIDMDRLQTGIKSAIRPAVEQALSNYDLQAAIVTALNGPAFDEDSIWRTMYGGRFQPKQTLLDQLVHASIQELAKEFVTDRVKSLAPMIEDGLRKMLVRSESKLSKAFAKAITDAFESNWGFDLRVSVEHTAARDDD